MFNFLLEQAANPLPMTLISIVLFGVIIYFFMIRPQKKQEKEHNAMKDALAVGDEVTTIGGIIGKVVFIKEETFVLETTKDKTKIRFLKGAIRSVDVKIADIVAAQQAEEEAAETPAEETVAENTEEN